MPSDWDLLPIEVKKRILEFTFMSGFQGHAVPSLAQVSTVSRVSRDFGKTSRELLADHYGDTVIAMRSSDSQILTQLLADLNAPRLNTQRCSVLLFRLSYMDQFMAMREGIQRMSTSIAQSEVVEPERIQLLKQLVDFGITTSKGGGTPNDSASLKAIIDEIRQRYRKETCLCVALGASADPVAVGLRMLGYTVEYIHLSGITESPEFRAAAIDYVKRKVATWPRNLRQILVMDAMASGTALVVIRSLISIAFKALHIPEPETILLSLNQPHEDYPVAKERVERGLIQTLSATPQSALAQSKIYNQEYKEGHMGRLFAKNRDAAKTPQNPQIDARALTRMVSTMLADRL